MQPGGCIYFLEAPGRLLHTHVVRLSQPMLDELQEIRKKSLGIADVEDRRRAQLIERGLIRVRYGHIEVTTVGQAVLSAYQLGQQKAKAA